MIPTLLLSSEKENCGFYSVSTPFNGLYSRTDVINEFGYPKYVHQNNYEAYFDGEVWTFSHPLLGILSDDGVSGTQIYPLSMQTWSYSDVNGVIMEYQLVPVTCTGKIPNMRFFFFKLNIIGSN